MQASAMLSSSPSLSSYSTSRLAEIAARVVDELELGLDPDPFCCDAMDFGLASAEQLLLQPPGEESASTTQFGDEDVGEAGGGGGGGGGEEEEEFEFAFVSGGPGSSPISADEIFYNGQIMPVYPVFNRNLLLSGVSSSERYEDGSKKTTTTTTKKLRLPLKKLLSQEREWSSSSSSSSESEELDGLTPGSYCVWRPPQSSAAVGKRCKKSNSTGTSKRWRFRDLLQLNRSHSDGEGTFLVVAPAKKRDKAGESKRIAAVADDDGTTATATAATDGKPAGKDEEKRKPLLPHRADLVGFFANARGLSRNLKLNPL
ncbi:hypothetical protein ACJRO7_009479 [Eucalyptus globulus]|uniref:Uncharacterized protein n=1 Tax=Eucalyptus globulus TaxID=34317 RepID=A0ABD3L8V5_EUCGL